MIGSMMAILDLILRFPTPHLRNRIHGEAGSRFGEVSATIGQSNRKIAFSEEAELEDCSSERLDRRRQIIAHRIDGADSKQCRPILHVVKAGLVHQAV